MANPAPKAASWYLAANGGLSAKAPKKPLADSFKWNAHATSPTDFTGDTASGPGRWTATPKYHWDQNPKGTAVSYLDARR